MGKGDDLMYRAEAYHHWRATGVKCRPYDFKKKRGVTPQINEIFRNTEWLDENGEPYDTHPNNGKRWYHKGTPYQPKRAPFEFDVKEIAWYEQHLKSLEPYIIINPDAKANSVYHDNKKWYHWQTLIDEMQEYTLIRCQPPIAHTHYSNIKNILTPTFRLAMLAVKNASLVITTEGGLHHAAGQFQTPAVVIYGSHSSPHSTGYSEQMAITSVTHCNPTGKGCHADWPCQYCERAMEEISPEQVLMSVNQYVHQNKINIGNSNE